MSSNQYINDRLSAHQLYIQRFAGRNVNELLKYIDDLEKQLQLLIIGVSSKNQRAVIAKSNKAIDDAISKLEKELAGNLNDFAEYEINFAGGVLASAVTVDVAQGAISKGQIKAITEKSLMNVQPNGKGITLGNAFKQFKAERNREFTRIVRDTVKHARSSRKVARELVKEEIKALNLKTKKDIRKKSLSMRHKAEAIIRTSVNHVGATAREHSFEKNADLFEGFVYTAVLDSRTTVICASRSGKFYKSNERKPSLPAHWNCRSLYVGRLKKEYNVYDNDLKSDNALNTSYQSFLKRQPDAFQNEVLGKKKAELFRSGKLTLDKFVDDSGKTYSIKTLAQLDKEYDLNLFIKK